MLRYRDMLPVRYGSSPLPSVFDRPSLFNDWGFGYGSPFHWFRQMDQEMNRLFSRFFGETPWPGAVPAYTQAWTPPVDFHETVEEWVIRAELPGVDPQDIEVTTTGNLLTFRGQMREEPDARQEGSYQTARRYGAFERAFPLPPTVQADAVTAEYRNGILEVHLPKTEEAKRQVRRIPIVAGSAATQPAIEGEKPTEAVAGTKGGEASSPEVEKGAKSPRRRGKKAGS